MLRLAAKLVAFFWRKADGPEEEVQPPGLEPWEGARGAGPACSGVGAGTGVGAGHSPGALSIAFFSR